MVRVLGFLKIFLIIGVLAYEDPAPRCPDDPSQCKLPNCKCSDSKIPQGFTSEETPQIVYLTFEGAILPQDYENIFAPILFNRINPNGGKISATFFVNHAFNNYQYTHELWLRGHEIALNSITLENDPNYWKTLNASGWDEEFVMQKKQMAHFAKIPESQIVGVRAPRLQPGGNNQFESISKAFEYDSSRTTNQYLFPGILWPYTSDFHSIQECTIPPCPTGSFKRFWNIPIVNLLSDKGLPCSIIDSCDPQPNSADEAFELLKRNFEAHYKSNKAPFGVFARSVWLRNQDNFNGYVRFLDYLTSTSSEKKDIYIVSMVKALFWLKTPTKLPEVAKFPPWFPKTDERNKCEDSFSCRFNSEGETPPSIPTEMYMTICQSECPNKFPWLYNWDGNGDYP